MNIKGQRAITLLSLVITVIILLILTGITLATLGENGLITKAKQAKIEQMKAEAKENIGVAVMQVQLNDTERGKITTLQDLHDKLPEKDNKIKTNDYDESDIELTGKYKSDKNTEFDFIIDEDFNVIIEEISSAEPKFNITIDEITTSSLRMTGAVEELTGFDAIKFTYVIQKTTGDPIKYENIAESSYTVTGLEQGTTYRAYMIAYDNDGNERTSRTKTIKTEAIPDQTTGAITFSELTWSNGKASLTISTTSNYYIEYQINGTSGEWTRTAEGEKAITLNNLNNGNVVYARLTDGIVSGQYTEKAISDAGKPTVTLSVNLSAITEIKATASATDAESGIFEDAIYTFYIKEQGQEYKKVQDTTSKTCIFTNLKQNTQYTVKVEVLDKAGNKGIQEKNLQTGGIPDANQTGSISVSDVTWTNGKAQVTITTGTDYKIEYQKNKTDVGAWEKAQEEGKAVTITDLNHNDIVYVRLTDGSNVGEYATIEIGDKEDPNEFEITVTDINASGCKVSGSTTDGQTGIKEYTYVAEPTAGGDAIKAEHITETTYTFTTLEPEKEYKVYMIAYDNAGNDRKSSEVTITTKETASSNDIEKAQDDSMFDKTENTTIEDDNGNPITIPAGFKVKVDDDTNNATTVDKGIVIIDRDGNEFVWVPVGKIYTDENRTEENAKTIELNRYTFDNDGNPTPQGDKIIGGYYQELATSPYRNTTAKSITKFKQSVEDNKGYYIGRYEARTGTARSSESDPITSMTEKRTDTVYNYVTQPQAAELSRNMYDNTKPFTSDLINSYAWDTAIIFLQKCGTYSQTEEDLKCNVYDIASKAQELTTETSTSSNWNVVVRSGYFGIQNKIPTYRDAHGVNYADANRGFRPILYIKEKIEIPDAVKEGTITVSEVTWEDGKAKVTINTSTDYQIEYQKNKIDEGTWEIAQGDGKTITITDLNHDDIIYARLTDGENSGQYATIEIVDVEKPNEFEIIVTEVTETGCKISGETTDAKTGIKDYTYVAEPTEGELIKVEHVIDTTYTFTTLEKGKEYKIYMIAYDNAGNDRKSSEVTTIIEKTLSVENVDTTLTDPISALPENTKAILEKDANNGIVIKDNKDNEWVWIEVPKTVTASATTDAEIETALQKYATDYRKGSATQNYEWKDEWYDSTGRDKSKTTKEDDKSLCGLSCSEYEQRKSKMLQSIKENGGFWISRYEAGIEGSDKDISLARTYATIITESSPKAVSKSDHIPYNNVTWEATRMLADGMYEGTDKTSSLLFGIQWDLVCTYLELKTDWNTTENTAQYYINQNSTDWGNYSNKLLKVTSLNAKQSINNGSAWKTITGTKPESAVILSTGASTSTCKMNIYDFAGNGWEMTLEYAGRYSYPCAIRGGCYIQYRQ